MKKIILPLFIAVGLALSGCGNANEETKTETTTETAAETEAAATDAASETSSTEESPAVAEETKPEAADATSSSANADCEKFLTDYEQFVDSYAVVAAKFAKSPTDMSIMSEYTEMATKAQEMQGNKPDACEADAAFMKRYLRIAAKMSKAAAAQAAGSAKMMEQMSKMSQ